MKPHGMNSLEKEVMHILLSSYRFSHRRIAAIVGCSGPVVWYYKNKWQKAACNPSVNQCPNEPIQTPHDHA